MYKNRVSHQSPRDWTSAHRPKNPKSSESRIGIRRYATVCSLALMLRFLISQHQHRAYMLAVYIERIAHQTNNPKHNMHAAYILAREVCENREWWGERYKEQVSTGRWSFEDNVPSEQHRRSAFIDLFFHSYYYYFHSIEFASVQKFFFDSFCFVFFG